MLLRDWRPIEDVLRDYFRSGYEIDTRSGDTKVIKTVAKKGVEFDVTINITEMAMFIARELPDAS